MSTSTSDHDSNTRSPSSYMESPYNSPMQQVPQMKNPFYGLSSVHNGNGPFLRIIIQPLNHFRFRYKSEMVGTHGCLLGETNPANKTKTHPTVELMNYSGRALIRCRLAQCNNPDEHPHKLLEDDQDRDVSAEVPEQGSYRVVFPGMGIIHTAKKDIAAQLLKKYSENSNNAPITREIRTQCEIAAKTINLNIVRLRFSAHDVETNAEICPPVFSNPIHNLKSAATNDLKICRMSRMYGRPRGGDDVFILVEKVNKKNIEVRFFELSESGEEVWSANAIFLHQDVHHQYAIVFRTPKYRDLEIASDVKVFIELRRPQDGRVSEPKEFFYKADPLARQNKKRKTYSSYSSFGSGSIKSLEDLPTTVTMMNPQNNNYDNADVIMKDISYTLPTIPQVQPGGIAGFISAGEQFGEALYHDASQYPSPPAAVPIGLLASNRNPMMSEPEIRLTSTEFKQVLTQSYLTPEENRKFCEINFDSYYGSNELSAPKEAIQNAEAMRDLLNQTSDENKKFSLSSITEFLCVPLEADSAGKKKAAAEKNAPMLQIDGGTILMNKDTQRKPTDKNTDPAFYKSQDGAKVKELVKELYTILKNKSKPLHSNQKEIVREKLEMIFNIRLTNGDTFLHMTLCSNLPSLEFIVKLIHNLQMTHLLNLRNNMQQTILHTAIATKLPKLIPFLISRGCDPMIEDCEGNNAIHYAVIYQSCLEPLLEAVKSFNVQCDLNAYNNEKQTALHLAALHSSGASALALLKEGANANARDSSGRTPLHLAVYDDCLPGAQAILQYTSQIDIDATDGIGYTALQIVCAAGIRENTKKIVNLLLEKKADPMKQHENGKSAWKLACQQIRELISEAINMDGTLLEDDIKSEPEEEDYDTPDEGEDVVLEHLQRYVPEVAALLDASGTWRALATSLHQEALLSWYEKTASPTTTLLNHIKECEQDVSSRSLAILLADMGQNEAARIIRRYID